MIVPELGQLDATAAARVVYPLVLGIYLAVAVLWRLVRVSARLRRPAMGTTRGWPHWRLRVLAIGLIAYGSLLFLLVVPFAVTGEVAKWTWPLADGARAWLLGVGMPLSMAGLALLLAAQVQMGSSWRLNIDREDPGPLLQHGLFRFCRNPVYLGVGIMVLGVAVGLLSGLSLLMLGCLWTTLALQVREEEAFLAEYFGEQYLSYASRVGRFLPGLGRLRLPKAAKGH